MELTVRHLACTGLSSALTLTANCRCKLEKSLTYAATLNNEFTKVVHTILTANTPSYTIIVESISEHCNTYLISVHSLFMMPSSMANTDTRTVILEILAPTKNSEEHHYRSTMNLVQDVTDYHQNKFQTTALIFNFYK